LIAASAGGRTSARSAKTSSATTTDRARAAHRSLKSSDSEAALLLDEAEQRDREAQLAAAQEANRIERQRVEAEQAGIEREEQIERERRSELVKIEQQAARSRAIISGQSHHDDEVADVLDAAQRDLEREPNGEDIAVVVVENTSRR
jgi:hypothetical protein